MTAVLVRLTVVLGVVVAGFAAPHPSGFGGALLVVGTGVTLLRLRQVGSGPAVVGVAVCVVVGAPQDVGPGRAALLAAALYLVHTATALAAALPEDARVDPPVLRRWVLRCGPAVAVTAAVLGLDRLVRHAPDVPAVTALALAAAVALAALVVSRVTPADAGDDAASPGGQPPGPVGASS